MYRISPQQRPLVKLALIAALAAAGLVLTAPGNAATANTTSSGTVVAPITITAATALAFGTFSPSPGGGSVTISTAGTRSTTGVQQLNSPILTAARFDITGQANTTYSIIYGGTPVLTNAGGGGETMAFTRSSDLTAANTTSGGVATGTLNGSGTQSLFVGGTLTVAGNQAPGVYGGTLSASVDYN